MSVWPGFPPAGMTAMLIGILVGETLLAVTLRNYRRISYAMVYVIALFVFAFHVWYFIDQRALHKYPSEFSHISYFIFSVCVIVGGKKTQAFASFCGMVTGIGFIIGGCFSPASMLTDAENGATLVISVMRHELLWLGGLLLFLNVARFDIKDIWISVVGIALIVGFSFLVHYHYIYPDFVKWDDMVIIKIATGTILGYVISGELPMWLRVGTVIVIFAAVACALVGYFKVNNIIYDRRLKRKLMHGGAEDTLELGVIPLVKYLLKRAGVIKAPDKKFVRSADYNCCELEIAAEEGVSEQVPKA